MSFVPLRSFSAQACDNSDNLVKSFLFALRPSALGSGVNIIAYNKDNLVVTGPGRFILGATWDVATARLHIKVSREEFVFDGGLWNLGKTEDDDDWVLLKNTTFINQFGGDPQYLKYVFKIAK